MKTITMGKTDFFELATRILLEQDTIEDKILHDFLLKNNKYRRFFFWYKSQWENNKDSQREFSYSRGLELLRAKIRDADNRSVKTPIKKFLIAKRVMRIAASVAVVLGLGYLSYASINNTSNKQTQDIAYITKTTGRGERVQIELPDGSLVHMNSESEILYPKNFEKKERNIRLKGEAFFEVVRDEKRPFIVRTGEITTTVLGTRFNVSNKLENVCVTLESGKVKITRENVKDEVFLAPGQQFSFDVLKEITKKENVNTNQFADWRKGILLFNGIKFSGAINQLEDWYNVNIECNSDGLLNRNIRGKYANEELKTVLEDLKFMFDFNYEFVNDSAIIINDN